MKENRSKIEKIKSVCIVVLFLSSILLLYFFWSDINPADFDLKGLVFEEEKPERLLLVENVLLPSQIIANWGDGEKSIIKDTEQIFYGNVLKNDRADSFLESIKSFYGSQNIFAEYITKEQYDDVFATKSMRALFDYYLPYADFCSYFGIANVQGMSDIKAISEIGFSTVDSDNLFVYDRQNEKYVRLIAENKENFLDGFFAKALECQIPYYYEMSTFLGEAVQNDLLLPLYLESSACPIELIPNDILLDSQRVIDEAKSYFGNSFDFVRKIEEVSGRTVFMYGYAERLLIAEIDGSIEYKDESSKGRGNEYFEALELALGFLDVHLGKNEKLIESLSSKDMQLFIRDASQIDDTKKGYRFELGLRFLGNEIFADDGMSVIIEVTNGNVSYFYKSIPYLRSIVKNGSESSADETPNISNSPENTEVTGTNGNSDTGSAIPEASNSEVFSAINTLATNYEYIDSCLSEASITLENAHRRKVSFEQIGNRISSMNYGYVRAGDMLLPAWRVEVAGLGVPLYFDLYTAEPIL